MKNTILFGLLVLICIGGAVLVCRSSSCDLDSQLSFKKEDIPETSEGWSTYGEGMGFKLDYPENLEITEGLYSSLSFPDRGQIYISTGEELSVMLPGTFGGRLNYLTGEDYNSLVFSEEEDGFKKDYFVEYGGSGSWDTVVNAYKQEDGLYYIFSLDYPFLGGVPETQEKREEMLETALERMRSDSNGNVQTFNQIIRTFRFED